MSLLTEMLSELEKGDTVEFDYGQGDNPKHIIGTIIANDGESSFAVRTTAGKKVFIDYTMIRRFQTVDLDDELSEDSKEQNEKPFKKPDDNIKTKSQAVPQRKRVPLYELELSANLSTSDNDLRALLNSLPRDEEKCLSSAFQSYNHGIRNNDKGKKLYAANKIQQDFWNYYDDGHDWSSAAARFCGLLCRREQLFCPQIFEYGRCYWEAAWTNHAKNDFLMTGVFAALALLEGNKEHKEDLLILLAKAIVQTNDTGFLRVMYEYNPELVRKECTILVSDLLEKRGVSMQSDQDIENSLRIMESLYGTGEGAARMLELLDTDQTPEEPVNEKAMEEVYGIISKLTWSNQTGTITSDDGTDYTFRYDDIKTPKLLQTLKTCFRADMDGKVYPVRFNAVGTNARNIFSDATIVERARTIAANPNVENRFRKAFAICRNALKTEDVGKAIYELIKNTLAIYKQEQAEDVVREAIGYYEENAARYPSSPFQVMDVAQCYFTLQQYDKAMELSEYALSSNSLEPKHRLTLLQKAMQFCGAAYSANGEKRLPKKYLEQSDEWISIYKKDLATEPGLRSVYQSQILPPRIEYECKLERLEAATEDLSKLSHGSELRPHLAALVEELRKKLHPNEEFNDEVGDSTEDEDQENDIPVTELSLTDLYPSAQDEAEENAEPLSYEDNGGWEALHTTKDEVVSYALSIPGEGRLAPMLAYLNAGAKLCKDIEPIYNMVALAANDPLGVADYSLTALLDAMSQCDPAYPILNDCCMGAAFLRASFMEGRGYDFGARSLRDSINISRSLQTLGTAYDIIEQFRSDVGHSIDIYADYRNLGMRKLKEEMTKLRRLADDLYTRFVESVFRESASFERFLDTKKCIFNEKKYLATMLRYVKEDNRDALMERKNEFVSTYLNGSRSLNCEDFNTDSIDRIIEDGWAEAGKMQSLRKVDKVLQGKRRNNIRSNIKEVLRVVCQWYKLSEQYEGYNWRTAKGEENYAKLAPRLMTTLRDLSEQCQAEMNGTDDPQYNTGLFLLKISAEELCARLKGTWTYEEQKYLYAEFLRTNSILLDENFLPNFQATFCALPNFNIFARIRKHVEQPKMELREHLEKIYGQDKSYNNYGTARRIMEYLTFRGESDSVELPENAKLFEEQSQLQANLSLRSFLETLALSQNYGRIMQSDSFCHDLDNTIRYWYAVCCETGNYGLFYGLTQQADEKIQATARVYEQQLYEQLEGLVASNQQIFREQPEQEEAIRVQISNQNFIVAEDWMHRIKEGNSVIPDVPFALKELQAFLNDYAINFRTISNLNSPLHVLYRIENPSNRDEKLGQKLLDNWFHTVPVSAPRVEILVDLLGWKNMSAGQDKLPSDPTLELYKLTKTVQSGGRDTFLHPIAAFGSKLEQHGMHVACLEGTPNSERLYATIRNLDSMNGNKILFLDCALGIHDRRALAQMMKQRESGLRNTYIIVDRMVITYLASHYSESLINAMLMAITMPFSYCQPYVAESSHQLPPEMFIGRKDELYRVEDPAGVNLIYGGRQLGKTALFRKAKLDLDGYQGNRAVLVDLHHMGCSAAARSVSQELVDLKILSEGCVTEDWDELCRNIKTRLRKEDDLIPYFLLMLDEADAFIEDCGRFNYDPIVALKSVQETLPERFKFVLGGLHNIVRFNRDVALGRNSVITHLSSLKITPFRTKEAQELLIEPMSYLGFSLPSNVIVTQILATVNYFPGMIQLYCQKLIESVRTADYAGYDVASTPPYIVQDDHIRRVMADRDFKDQIYEKYEITLKLDVDQGCYYYPLALLISLMYYIEPSTKGYTPQDVLDMAQSLNVYRLQDLDVEKLEALMLELLDLNILRNVSDNTYLLASKNFRDLLGSEDEIEAKLRKLGGTAE